MLYDFSALQQSLHDITNHVNSPKTVATFETLGTSRPAFSQPSRIEGITGRLDGAEAHASVIANASAGRSSLPKSWWACGHQKWSPAVLLVPARIERDHKDIKKRCGSLKDSLKKCKKWMKCWLIQFLHWIFFSPLALFGNSRETRCCEDRGENVKNDQTQKVPKRTLAGPSPSLKQEVSNGFIKPWQSKTIKCFFS